MDLNKILVGDCLIKLKELEDNSVDSIVTDPPYHLVSIVKRFGKEDSAPAKYNKDGSFKRLSGGFMGKTWDGLGEDGIGIANNPVMWAECLRVLKPGGYLLSFGGTRTYHRMACAIEDAGFEVRDMIEWVYASGFPKSLNIGKALDKKEGNLEESTETLFNNSDKKTDLSKRSDYGYKFEPKSELAKQWEGWGTALKPAHEPICMARKPLAEKTVAENCLKWGTGGINIDESRVGTTGARNNGNSQGTVGSNSIGVYGKAIKQDYNMGRFPANLIHDNSEEVRECFPSVGSKSIPIRKTANTGGTGNVYTTTNDDVGNIVGYGDTGNASRFFKSIIYVPKASKSERNKGCEGLEEKDKYKLDNSGNSHEIHSKKNKRVNPQTGELEERKETDGLSKNNHPTVKPIALMEYLIKMVTPKGGIVLDPFAGSGSTLVAAKQNGFNYVGIEMTEEYIPIIEARLNS